MKRFGVLLACLTAVLAVVGVSLAADITGPTLTLSESSSYEYVSDSTLYYAPTGTNTGSFTVTATASSDAGIESVAFPTVFGSDSATDTTSTYSQTYSWTSSSSASGSKSVVATDAEDDTASSSFTVTPDTTAPSGQSIALTGGPWFSTLSVPLTIKNGTDSGAGVDTGQGVVERASAPLASATCGTFGTFAAVTLASGADTSVTTGNCYRYQYKAADNVGNLSTASTASADAMVDATAPSAPSLFFSGLTHTAASEGVVYYPATGAGSFTVSAVAADAESGVAEYEFSTPPGFGVAGAGASRTFSFSGAQGSAQLAMTVTAKNGAGLVSPASSYTLTPDPTPPALTIRCNGKPCASTAYKKAVTVSMAAVDTGGSGVDTIRYTTDGRRPSADVGTDYDGPFTVNTLTKLRVQAYDKAGNASGVVSVTIRSLADRLVFTAPRQVKAAGKARYLKARVTCSARATVTAVLRGAGLKKPQRWRFLLDSGTTVVRFTLPKAIKRPGRYTVGWTVVSGTKTAKRSTRVVIGNPKG